MFNSGVKILSEFWRFLETVKNLSKERFKHSEWKYISLMFLFYNFPLLRVLSLFTPSHTDVMVAFKWTELFNLL